MVVDPVISLSNPHCLSAADKPPLTNHQLTHALTHSLSIPSTPRPHPPSHHRAQSVHPARNPTTHSPLFLRGQSPKNPGTPPMMALTDPIRQRQRPPRPHPSLSRFPQGLSRSLLSKEPSGKLPLLEARTSGHWGRRRPAAAPRVRTRANMGRGALFLLPFCS